MRSRSARRVSRRENLTQFDDDDDDAGALSGTVREVLRLDCENGTDLLCNFHSSRVIFDETFERKRFSDINCLFRDVRIV